MITLVGAHHYDKLAERRIKAVLRLYKPKIIFVEGIENWDVFESKASELKKELFSALDKK